MAISASGAQRRHRAGALLLDIRPQIARHQGSITDAVLVDVAAVAERFNLCSSQRIPDLDYGREIIVCSVSARRAIPTAELLARLGYRNIYYLADGYSSWPHRDESGAAPAPLTATDNGGISWMS